MPCLFWDSKKLLECCSSWVHLVCSFTCSEPSVAFHFIFLSFLYRKWTVSEQLLPVLHAPHDFVKVFILPWIVLLPDWWVPVYLTVHHTLKHNTKLFLSLWQLYNLQQFRFSATIPLERLTSGSCCLLRAQVQSCAEIGIRESSTHIAQPEGRRML